MNKLICIVAIVLLTQAVKGQVYDKFYPKNTVMAQFMPFQSSPYFDLGLGLRYSRQVCNAIGLYGSFAYVNHRLHYGGYIHNHYRTALGAIWFTKLQLEDQYRFNVSAGLVYSHYGIMRMTVPGWSTDLFYPLSFEVGVSVRMFDKLIFFKNANMGLSFDFMKNESCINFGYSF